jgi:hypothetical protein
MKIRPMAMMLLLMALNTLVIAGHPSPQAVFDQIKTLEGTWRSASGQMIANYKLIANGSSIVETWTMSPTRESMTVYTMDGDRIIVTHYCPQGNAPRLELSKTGTDGTHFFEFLDGANLQKATGHHEHAFWMRMDSADSLVRSETYIGNSATYDPKRDLGSIQTFTRVK